MIDFDANIVLYVKIKFRKKKYMLKNIENKKILKKLYDLDSEPVRPSGCR